MPRYGSGSRRIFKEDAPPDWFERPRRRKNNSLTNIPAQDPGPGAYVPNHLAESYARHTHASSVSPLTLMVSLSQQSEDRGS
jgi:hypothetical protein